MRLLGAVVCVLGGVALAAQGRVNGQLGLHLGDGLVAALISFVVGTVILGVAVAVTPSWRAAAPRFTAALRGRTLPPWHCLGGVAGAGFVTAQGLTVPLLGVALFTVAGVAGQVVSGLLVDRSGFGPGEPRPVTPTRALGAGLAVVAVLVAVSHELGVSTQALWLSLIPAVAGAGIGWAAPANGLVRAATGSVAFAAFVNFVVGVAVLLLACGIDVAVRGLPAPPPTQAWLYLGGLLGIIGMSSGVFAIRHIGALMLGLCLVAGQVIGAVLLDLFVPTPGTVIPPTTFIGVAITLLAAGVAAVPSGRRGTARVRG
ncbi:DMT family transporter [Actinokineospora sp. NBRC 105648]|uniref:DMT family transporter n=1 Tax=Actinokineospora sp. NBRC 105648 TaxID=3032206 RepID=UPI0024A3806A|nr:DMT family transporter [Actinokineospora sp. NBRC 105648]GLZ43276.1 membrane protein [Actinokineospora sp. NBRC 105648]